MELNDLVALSKAGWNKEEILSLIGTQQPKEETVSPEIPEEKEAAPQAAPIEAPKDDSKYDEVIAKLDKLTSGIQRMAVQDSRLPERESVDDILAKILNP